MYRNLRRHSILMVDFLREANYMEIMRTPQKSRKFISRNPKSPTKSQPTAPNSAKANATPRSPNVVKEGEIGGYDGPEPTRFGDWQHNGRCTDF